MSLLHPESRLLAATQLDLFNVPPTMAQTKEGMWVTHKTIINVADLGHIEFCIQGNADYYLDLANTLLYMKAKINKVDGTAFIDTDQVAPVNLWMHTMFSQNDAYLNDKLVTPSSNTYAYHAHVETYNYGKESL